MTSLKEALIRENIGVLLQGRQLLERLEDETYAALCRPLGNHRAGSHLRHCIEFFESVLEGTETASIDYDARKRDKRIETDRRYALRALERLIARLETDRGLRESESVRVRLEDAASSDAASQWMGSTVTRELQFLRSHTIHHYALIAATLRAFGVEPGEHFGMAPSTLRHLQEAAACAR
jgi:uncharacterized damage-inducible protein DinB